MPLYKSVHTVTSYFWSEKKGPSLKLEAEDHAKDLVRESGFDEHVAPTVVKAGEDIEGDWEPSFQVPGDPAERTLGEILGALDDAKEEGNAAPKKGGFATVHLESIRRAALDLPPEPPKARALPGKPKADDGISQSLKDAARRALKRGG